MRALTFDRSREAWNESSGMVMDDVPEPRIDESTDGDDRSQVLIRVRYTGFCGTDRGIWGRKSFGDMIEDSLDQARRLQEETGEPARVFEELVYRTRTSWSRSRRVVAKAEYLPGKANPRYVVTSFSPEEIDARMLYEDLYCARGEMENRIKEQQLDLFADRTSAATMWANQLRLYFSSLAYCLLQALRRLGLAGTSMAKAQCSTLRLRLLKIGARVKVTVRKVWVSLSQSYPDAEVFIAAHHRLLAPPAS